MNQLFYGDNLAVLRGCALDWRAGGTVENGGEFHRAVELLIAAAENGGKPNIGAATHQLEIVLRAGLRD